MSIDKRVEKSQYEILLERIGFILDEGRTKAYSTVNNILIKTYWEIGREIVEYEQQGKEKA